MPTNARVRAFLENFAKRQIPITYQELAKALQVLSPHSIPPPITTALGGLADVERRTRTGRDGAGQRHAGGTLRRRGGCRAPWLSTCGSFGGISPHIDQYAFQRLHLFEDTAGAER